MVPELKNLDYDERLMKLKLTRLKERRIRGDMIETYKILTGKEDISSNKFFKFNQQRGDTEIRGPRLSTKRFNLIPR